MQDRIEKSIELNAPVARVWRALTDHREFGEWFRARLEGPFVVGEVALGQATYPGYEHMSLPDEERRESAYERNSQGWEAQTKNITGHVES
jgi:hypothetical protein